MLSPEGPAHVKMSRWGKVHMSVGTAGGFDVTLAVSPVMNLATRCGSRTVMSAFDYHNRESIESPVPRLE